MPIWGRLSDLSGRKPLFQTAIAVFLAGSALSGLAQSLGELIAFRALQGLGAGGLMTLAMAIVADIIPPRERGRYQGYIQLVFVLASVAGPLLGGLFVDHLSWRWIFYVNLPIGALALVVISSTLHLPVERRRPQIDYPGAALLAGGLTSVLLVATWGGRQYAWASLTIVGLALAAVVLLGAFVWQERRAPEPILPLRLFRDRVFDVVSLALFLTSCAFFAAIVFMPLFLQIVTGASATTSGLLLLPMLLGAAASTAVSGRLISRSGRYKIFPLVGLAVMALGLLLLSGLDVSSSRTAASVLVGIFGVGFGLVSQVLVLAIQNAVEPVTSASRPRRRTSSARSAARSAWPSSARSSRAGSPARCRATCRPGRRSTPTACRRARRRSTACRPACRTRSSTPWRARCTPSSSSPRRSPCWR